MLNKDEIIQDAVEAVIEQTDLAPGEVNENIQDVMETIEKADSHFNKMRVLVDDLNDSAGRINNNSTELAEAGVQMAKSAQQIGKTIQDLQETQEDLSENMEELTETLDRLETYMPEEE